MLIAVLAATLGCEGMPREAKPELQVRPDETASPAGHYVATAGRTRVKLELTEDAVTAVTFTEPRQSAPVRGRTAALRNASADGGADAVWVIFHGDATVAGNTVTVSITRVVRDGQNVAGADLKEYADCAITATAGDTFGEEVTAGILRCLGTTEGDAVTVHKLQQETPSDLLLGNWLFRGESLYMTIGENELTVTFEYSGYCSLPLRLCSGPVDRARVTLATSTEFDDNKIFSWKIRSVTMTVSVGGASGGGTVSATECSVSGAHADYCAGEMEAIAYINRAIAAKLPIYYTVNGEEMVWAWRWSATSQENFERLERVAAIPSASRGP